ncbi:MAG: sigma-54-dependent Fis family transcriptional regulator [Sandaracinaceae bacterium]|nr:sigma-54-dependent Fis family transcriptional regulator [Sandaracinaceae bacterium]
MTDASRDAPTMPASEPEPGGARARPVLVALTVAHHRDPSRVGERALVLEQESGRAVRLARHELGFAHPGEVGEPRPLADPKLSRRAIELRVARGELELAVPDGVELRVDGRLVTGVRRLDAARLAEVPVLEIGRAVVLLAHPVELGARPERHAITGESVAVDGVRRSISRVADLAVPVLVEGESGVGKERVARAIHDASGRTGPYVAVNVATLPASLAASELFGHSKGAFTGATEAHAGLFERADGGTLFLDEIGEIAADVQAMLLRVLELGEVRRLGTGGTRAVDVRVIAATDSDLAGAVSRGGFRQALLHRLRGFVIEVPPLRARREDIPRLVVELLREELAATGELARLEGEGGWLDRATMVRLLSHPWPGNVRQLRGVLRQIVVSSRGEPALVVDDAVERRLALEAPVVEAPTRESVTPEAVLEALRAHGWSFTRAARALGLSKAAFYRLAEAHPGVRVASELDAEELAAALREHGDVERAAAALEVSARALKLRLAALGMSDDQR